MPQIVYVCVSVCVQVGWGGAFTCHRAHREGRGQLETILSVYHVESRKYLYSLKHLTGYPKCITISIYIICDPHTALT